MTIMTKIKLIKILFYFIIILEILFFILFVINRLLVDVVIILFMISFSFVLYYDLMKCINKIIIVGDDVVFILCDNTKVEFGRKRIMSVTRVFNHQLVRLDDKKIYHTNSNMARVTVFNDDHFLHYDIISEDFPNAVFF